MDLINSESASSLYQNNIIWAVFLLVLLAFVIISTILVYHWQRYGIHKNTVTVVAAVYFFISLILLFSLFQATLSITSL